MDWALTHGIGIEGLGQPLSVEDIQAQGLFVWSFHTVWFIIYAVQGVGLLGPKVEWQVIR